MWCVVAVAVGVASKSWMTCGFLVPLTAALAVVAAVRHSTEGKISLFVHDETVLLL